MRVLGRALSMQTVLRVTGVLETATGVALLAAPSAVAVILVGAPLETPASALLGRVAGAALLSLGLACWRETADAGVVACALVYNVLVIGLLGYACFGLALIGVGLWPAIVVHAALASWCIALLTWRSESIRCKS
jgi:hypothetical protein